MAENTAVAEQPVAAPLAVREPIKPDKAGYVWGTGRRKTAVARVRIKPGSGKFLINDREVDHFFPEIGDRAAVRKPLKETKTEGSLDVFAKVHGGGLTGQTGAVVLGLSRALMGYDPSLEPALREHNLLTRDAREVERKKYGQSGARRRFQFSKR
ncbi:MAG: 30S ribosomal protein S9 [Phycisphaeraceae bacterium]